MVDLPETEYDVSSQGISVHILLHRLLSLVLHRALKGCYDESKSSAADSSVESGDFFGRVLGGLPLKFLCFCYGTSSTC